MRLRRPQRIGPRLLTRQIERFDCGDLKDCICCGEDDPVNECPKSPRYCGHHCGHIWTHDSCCWCKASSTATEGPDDA